MGRSTGDTLVTAPSRSATPYELSPTRNRFAVADLAELIAYSTETWSEPGSFDYGSRIKQPSFSPDDRRLAVGELDSAYVIDLDSGVRLQQIALPGVSDFVWVDDETVIIGTNVGLSGTLSLSTDDFLEATRASLQRTFIEDECRRYDIDPCPTLEDLRGG